MAAVRRDPATDRWPAAAASTDLTPHVIAAVGLNWRALGSRHLPSGRLLAPDCALTWSRMHRAAHPKSRTQVVSSGLRSMPISGTVSVAWEESPGKSQLMLERQNILEHWTGAFGKIGIVHRACPLCEHDNAAQPASRYSHDIWEVKNCSRCGFVYIEKAPDYEALFSNMAWERTTKVEEQRRAVIRPFSYKFSKRTRWRLHILPRKKMHLLVEAHARPGNLIDLGCGDGGAMAKLNADFVPFGVEISKNLAASANEVFGARGGRAINAPSLEGLKEFPDAFFSAATLRSYLEHEMKPAPVLRELHRTLAPGAVAIVKVPNYGSLNRMVTGRKWCGFRYPDHPNYFTPGTLRAMAEGCGYRVWFGLTFRLPTSDNMYAVLTKT